MRIGANPMNRAVRHPHRRRRPGGALAAHRRRGGGHQARDPRQRLLPPAARGPPRRAVRAVEAAHDGHRRRGHGGGHLRRPRAIRASRASARCCAASRWTSCPTCSTSSRGDLAIVGPRPTVAGAGRRLHARASAAGWRCGPASPAGPRSTGAPRCPGPSGSSSTSGTWTTAPRWLDLQDPGPHGADAGQRPRPLQRGPAPGLGDHRGAGSRREGPRRPCALKRRSAAALPACRHAPGAG